MSKVNTQIPDEFTSTTNLTTTERHRLLASERRRVVLDLLTEQASPTTSDELALAVTRKELGRKHEDEQTLHRVQTTLHHVHLPMMADLDILEYDTTTHQIRHS